MKADVGLSLLQELDSSTILLDFQLNFRRSSKVFFNYEVTRGRQLKMGD